MTWIDWVLLFMCMFNFCLAIWMVRQVFWMMEKINEVWTAIISNIELIKGNQELIKMDRQIQDKVQNTVSLLIKNDEMIFKILRTKHLMDADVKTMPRC